MAGLWKRVGVRTTSVGLLVVGAIGGVYVGQVRDVQVAGVETQLVAQADANEIMLLKARQNQHAAARSWQRAAEGVAAERASADAKTAATKARDLEKSRITRKAEEKAEKARKANALVPYDGPIPSSCKEFSGNQATGCALMLEAGFGIDQFPCLKNLWNKESGWNARAENRSSGAYGIPQALPGSKMGTVASDWKTNAATQIKWGLGYIKGRYKTPCGAWSYFQNNGHY
ncbi:lytic transglycosylase domain-containing protein [Actinoplanes sp. NPDC051494]|uniref:aggregation-promoting factor C-terminal-like domain-containing protein n=1 Tax=Actinoplanes sp. NPDC051494 TaxID=3363907 RepID=UPI00379A4CF0